jgi:serine/threonine protein kinase
MQVLKHPNIVRYIDSHMDWKKQGGDLYIVLEYVEGGSLAKIMHDTSDGTLPESLVTVYIARMLCGLIYLHDEGVIHRDIKAANILVDRDGGVRLADFGVAIQSTLGSGGVDRESLQAEPGAVNDVVGTPYWMAPEVIQMTGATTKSDVWSVGCTVMELLTGSPPYAELPQVPALFRIVQDAHPPLHELAARDPELHGFFMCCFDKDPRLRSSAQQLSQHGWLDLEAKMARQSAAAQASGGESAAAAHSSEVWSGSTALAVTDQTISRHREISSSIQSFRASARGDTWQSAMSGDGGERPAVPLREESAARHQTARPTQPQLDMSTSSLATSEEPALLRGAGPSHRAMQDSDGRVHSNAASSSSSSSTRGGGSGGRAVTDHHDDNDPWSDQIDGRGLEFTISPRGAAGRIAAGGRSSAVDSIGSVSSRASSSATAAASSSSGWHGRGAAIGGEGPEMSTEMAAAAALEREIQPRGVGERTDHDGADADADEEVREVERLIQQLNVASKDSVIKSVCEQLAIVFVRRPEIKSCLISHHGIIPLMEILDNGGMPVKEAALILVNQVTQGDPDFQQKLCLVGLLPLVVRLGLIAEEPASLPKVHGHGAAPRLLQEVTRFVAEICKPRSSTLALQVFIACQGLPVLVNILRCDFATHSSLIHLAMDAIWHIFTRQSNAKFLLPNLDICRLFVKEQILPCMASLLTVWIRSGDDAYQERAVNLFVQFARADWVVREAMAKPDVLSGIIFGLDELQHVPARLLKLLHCVTRLTMCATAIEALEAAGAVQRLVRLADPELAATLAYSEGDVRKVHAAALLSLFYLCGGKAVRLMSFRQLELAAIEGLIPYLQYYIHTHSELQDIALQMFCSMPYAGARVRGQLWKAMGHLFYLELLKHSQANWRLRALEALVHWLSHTNAITPTRDKLERVLLEPKNVAKLVHVFSEASDEALVEILVPYVGLLSGSEKLARACFGIAPAVLARLNTDSLDVKTVIELLKLLLKLLENHRSPVRH